MPSFTTENSSTGIGRWLFENRDYTPIPLILILAFYASPTPLTTTLGLLIILSGELLRIYAVAFIGSVSRTRTTSLGHQLVTTGPFSWVRNPLYLANFLIVTGVGVFSGRAWFICLTSILFFIQYLPIVQYEETLLEEKFGDEYRSYRARTPMWWPSKIPTTDEFVTPPELEKAIKSEKRTMTAILAVVVLILI